jgi:hypothetical protein
MDICAGANAGDYMTDIKLNYIDIGGMEFPIYCDLNVLEKAQEEFESLTRFERELIGLELVRDADGNLVLNEDGTIKKKEGEPKIKALSFALREMVREGRKIEERQTGEEPVDISEDELIELCDIGYRELSFKLHQEFNRCFEAKKKKKVTKTKKTNPKTNTTS